MSTEIRTAIVMTRDMEALARFYRDGLELADPAPTGPNHLGFELGSFYLGFDEVGADTPIGAGGVTLWFTVDDLDETFERFGALGATVKYPPTEKPWGARLAAVHDPDGNLVGLSQRSCQS